MRDALAFGLGIQMLIPTSAVSTYAAGSAQPAVTSASITGGSGTVTATNGVLYAKSGAPLTLTVNTNSDTQCVAVTGAFTGQAQPPSGKSTFTVTAPAGDGQQNASITAYARATCTGQSGTGAASYVLDNTGPSLTSALSPSPNALGWNNSNVTITWSAIDGGVGVGTGPTPLTDSVSANSASSVGTTKTASATDLLGNPGSGSAIVKLDKQAPTIVPGSSPAANANGWNDTDVVVSFTCSDALSGIRSCPGSTTVSAEGANQTVSGTALDNAGNPANAAVLLNIDKTRPTLSGSATTSPNANGWYNGNVTIHWTGTDAVSGIDASTQPADSTISGEGQGLTATASVSDRAGNRTTATSSSVNIDKTAPTTTAAAPTNWNNTDATVTLTAADTLSGVAGTYYVVDGGATQSGTRIVIGSEGIHTLSYWSIDKAGNAEAAKTIQVKIDKTPPTITHTQSPLANPNGWNNANVTVTFVCSDALSGIASCTAPQTVSSEGKAQLVSGTATDAAGNSATDPATVSIDRTPPSVAATVDRAPNTNGWYNADVIVSFTATDALSGIATSPSPRTLSEGVGQTASGTAVDAAGNSATAVVSGINIDETKPTLAGMPTTAPNAAGWYRGDVAVRWSASDALSGLSGSAPADSIVTGEGDNLSTSASVSDNAGNIATTTVGGIRIDRTAPSTAASVPAPLASGWYAAAPTITLSAVDSLSGVAATYYAIDGGAAQTYTAPFPLSQGGSHTLVFWSMDKAGNVEDNTAPANSLTLKVDNVPPTIHGTRLTPASTAGWNTGPVEVAFDCSDAESGIATCTSNVVLNVEGASQSVLGTATDNAGNTSTTTVDGINIDLTPPVLSGAPSAKPNAAGWYNSDVVVHWSGVDTLSGIDSSTQPADSLLTGEGSDLSAGPVTISDLAGNLSRPASVSGIKIDRTAPTTLADGPTGWTNSAATVNLSATDNLSGVTATDYVVDGGGQQVGASVSVATEGTHTVRYWSVDQAGNAEAAHEFTVQIDKTVPIASAIVNCADFENGFCQGTSAEVALAATDDRSGVRELHYAIGSSDAVVAAGASASVTVPLTDAAESKLSYWAVDNAGNASEPQVLSLQGDDVPPTITATVDPLPNANGWNNSSVSVKFTAEDNPGGSGVANVTGGQTLTAEALATDVTATAADLVGNVSHKTVTVHIDETAPVINGAATVPANGNGWYNGPVTVHFQCSDALSGVDSCTADQVLTTDGTNLSVTGSAADKAGNTASRSVTGINIDTVKPTVTLGGVTNGAVYIRGSVPQATCSATDDRSGIDGACSVQLTGAAANGTGMITATARARDKAGNVSDPVAVSYTVYAFDFGGWQQPLASPVQSFKTGSTVPVKFQLLANGTPVQASVAPRLSYSINGGPLTAASSVGGSNIGDAFRWDGAAQQYIYNLKTTGLAAGKLVLHVTFEDGSAVDVSTQLTLK